MIPKLTFSTAPPTLGDLIDLQKATRNDDHAALLQLLIRRTGAKEADLRGIHLGHELALVLEQLKTSIREAALASESAEKKAVQ